MAWRWAAASVVGEAHVQNGERLQDAYAVSTFSAGCILAVVSDGAGTATNGAFGAWLTCRHLSVRFREWCQNPELPNDEELSNWVKELRAKISSIAARRGTVSRQFAATLAAIAVTPREQVTLHIGDSAVVGRKRDEWEVLCCPENGEYASSTYFVTDVPEPRLNIVRQPREHDAFALFSDGVGDFALSHLGRIAHSRFFDPMVRPVDIAAGEGRLPELSARLAAYLASPPVSERTDDDKTLILISDQ